jgi:ABC-2 type transport system ATP-binding protein
MREAEELCDRVALISEGRIVAEGTAAELKCQVKSEEAILIQGQFDPGFRDRLARVPGVLAVAQDEDACRLLVRDRQTMKPVLRALLNAEADFAGIRFDEPTLEDVFLMLTQKGLEVGDE